MTPLAVTGGLDWLAIGDAGIWLYGTAPQPVSALAPRSPEDEVVALAAAGNLLYAATRDRIDLLDRAAETVAEIALPESMRLVDVARMPLGPVT